MRIEMKFEARVQLLEVIAHVIVRDALEAALPQRRGDGVDIRAADLVRQHGLAGLDEFVAGGDHDHQGWLLTRTRAMPRRGRDRDFRRAETQRPAPAATRPGGSRCRGGARSARRSTRDASGSSVRLAGAHRDLLDRHHGIAAGRQHRAGHDLDAG